MSVYDKIKSSVADVSQKNNSWVSDASTKTKSSVASVFNKISTQLQRKGAKFNRQSCYFNKRTFSQSKYRRSYCCFTGVSEE